MRRGGKGQAAGIASGSATTSGLPLALFRLQDAARSPSSPCSDRRRRLSTQAQAPPDVVRDRVPQRDRLHLLHPAHQQPQQPPVASLRVDALYRTGPVLVDLLRLITLHPHTPLPDNLAVRRERLVAIPVGVFRLWH